MTTPDTENWSASQTVIRDPGARPESSIGIIPSALTTSPPELDVEVAGLPELVDPPIVATWPFPVRTSMVPEVVFGGEVVTVGVFVPSPDRPGYTCTQPEHGDPGGFFGSSMGQGSGFPSLSSPKPGSGGRPGS